VAKAELGTKRLCAHCGAKFYDLNKDPIVCPKCSTVFHVVTVAPRGRPDAAAAAAAAARAAAKPEVEAPETADAEFVSLEDADAEAQGKKTPAGETAEAEEEIEMDESLDDAAFIPEEEEEDDADVTDIIGDVDNEEES
jgi:uncharacterized protein (TIGR02300 family)